jgi:hypothetical protein
MSVGLSAVKHAFCSMICVVSSLAFDLAFLLLSFCAVENMRLTAFHPMLRSGGNAEGEFPCMCTDAVVEDTYDGYVYDFVLKNRSILASPSKSFDRNDSAFAALSAAMFVATFGHTVRSSVFSHAYFGSEAVVTDLKSHPAWGTGFITLNKYNFVRAAPSIAAEGDPDAWNHRVIGLQYCADAAGSAATVSPADLAFAFDLTQEWKTPLQPMTGVEIAV